MSWFRWKPYVRVADRQQKAAKQMQALRKKGVDIQPVVIEGRKIAKTFWGEAWCDHLESFGDYANRLPRGRTYVRNGSVCHLAIEKGKIDAKVSGSELYDIEIRIKTLPKKKWSDVKRHCSGQIGSLLELLQGNLSDNIMSVVTDRKTGLFPLPNEISYDCDCPDWAGMCKHIAAVIYGIGARLDADPALLFELRGVKHDELIDAGADLGVTTKARKGGVKRLRSEDLGDVFGIDLSTAEPDSATKPAKARAKSKSKSAAKTASPAKKKTVKRASTRNRKTNVAAVAKKTARAASAQPKSPKKSVKGARKAAGATIVKVAASTKKAARKPTTKKKVVAKTVTAKAEKQARGPKTASGARKKKARRARSAS